MRSTYKVQNLHAVYFITSTIVNWIEVFTSEKYCRILIDAVNFYIDQNKFTVYSYIIMKNHFHMICKSENLIETIRLIKSYTAKKIITELEADGNEELLQYFRDNKKQHKTGRTYQIWQEGFHPQEMINNEVMKQKIEYIHSNPVKENYCSKPVDWKYSSAEYYENGSPSLIPLEKIV